MATNKEKRAVLESAEQVTKAAEAVLDSITRLHDQMSDLNVMARLATRATLTGATSEDEEYEAASMKENWEDLRRVIQHADARLTEMDAHVELALGITRTISEEVGEVAEDDEEEELPELQKKRKKHANRRVG